MTLDTHLVLWILIIDIFDFIVSRIEWWIEYKYDANKDLKKKKTKSTKKTTTQPDGSSVTEEAIETSEPIKEEK